MTNNPVPEQYNHINLIHGGQIEIHMWFNDLVPLDPKHHRGLSYTIHDMYKMIQRFPQRGMEVKCEFTGDWFRIERVRFEPSSPQGEEPNRRAKLVFHVVNIYITS